MDEVSFGIAGGARMVQGSPGEPPRFEATGGAPTHVSVAFVRPSLDCAPFGPGWGFLAIGPSIESLTDVHHPLPGTADDAGKHARPRCALALAELPALPHGAVLTADRWPDEVPLPSFGPLMVCIDRGIVSADVRPHWAEQPTRESITGSQWRSA
jgi:hypothetical protein